MSGSRRGMSLAVVALLLSCGNGVLSPTELLELSAARERWRDHGGPNYTVESRISCFCPYYLNVWTRLTVQGDEVVAAEPLSPLPEGEESSTEGWYTVHGLHEAIARAAKADYLRDVK